MRHASEMTDGERARIESFMPPVKVLGGPRTTDLREVVDGLLYLLRASGPWRLLPKDLEATIQRRGLALPRQHPAPHAAFGKGLKNHTSFRVKLLDNHMEFIGATAL